MTQARALAPIVLNGGDSPAERAFARYVDSAFKPRVSQLVGALAAGRISVDEWERAMTVEIDFVTVTAAALGKGGVDTLDDADYAVIRQWTAEQHAYLKAWANELREKADGKGLLLLAALTVGGGAVAQAATGAISAAGLIVRALAYAKSAQSLLAVAATLALGMPILPAYPRDNSSRCLFNDACTWEIVPTGAKSWDCYWRLSIGVESCENCLRRADVWNPLRIVDGVIQPYSSIGLFA